MTNTMRTTWRHLSLLNRKVNSSSFSTMSSGGITFLSGLSATSGRQQRIRESGEHSSPNMVASDILFASNIGSSYVSPYEELFSRMHANGPTTLGTTPELLEFERLRTQHQRKLVCGILESDLRFTTTSFGRTLVAPHVHPNEHRVIMKINTRNIPLDTTGVLILREIVGNRYNEERKEFRLSSNQFGSRIENKRHLVSMLDRIILSCQRMVSGLEQTPAQLSPNLEADTDMIERD